MNAQTNPLNVLLIEDNRADARLIEESLKSAFGQSVKLVNVQRLKDGLLDLDHNDYDVALLDLGLPDSSGLDSVRGLVGAAPDLPIVVITGQDDESLGEEALGVGAQDYLVKGRGSGFTLRRAVRYARTRKADAEALRRSAEQFRALIETSMIGVCIHTGYRPQFANRACAQIFGFDDALRLQACDSLLDFCDPDERERILSDDERRKAEDPDTGFFEMTIRRKDGSRAWLDVRTNAATWWGSPAEQWIVSDITARKEGEKAVADRSREFGAIAKLGIVALTSNGLDAALDAASQILKDVSGADSVAVWEAIPGSDMLRLRAGRGWTALRAGESTTGMADSPPGHALRTGVPVIFEDFQSEDRFQVPDYVAQEGLRSGAAVVIPGHGQQFGVLSFGARQPNAFSVEDMHFLQAVAGFLSQIVDRERIETMFRQTQRLESLGMLTGGIAHDFNNLLTVVMGSLELLEEDCQELPEASQHVSNASQAAHRGAELIQRLLAFSRNQTLEPETLNVNDVVENVIDLIRRTISERIGIVTRLDPDLHLTRLDRSQLETALINLAINARDAIDGNGQLELGTANVEREAADLVNDSDAIPGQYVMLTLSDDGCGMSPELVERVFDPFFTTKKPGSGTGLGLSMVYGFVKQSQGLIDVDSKLGRGTTIRMLFPTAVAETQIDSSGTPSRPRELGSELILVVEDDPDVRRITRRMLESLDYLVMEAANSAEALNILESCKGIQLVLTDAVMPGEMSGPELVTEIHKRYPSIKTLFATGYTDSVVIGDTVVDVLSKPFKRDELARRIRNILEN